MKIDNVANKIVNSGFCCSCGTCKFICPNKNIRMIKNTKTLDWEAQVINEKQCMKCNGVKNCLSVCPMFVKKYNVSTKEKLGHIDKVYTGYSKNSSTRYDASSGGFVRTICKDLLQKKIINGVVALHEKKGMEYGAYLYRKAGEIDEMPNSIYHSIYFGTAIEIIKRFKGRLLIVGLPCQITGIINFFNDKRNIKYQSKIFLTISLICGYSRSRKNLTAYCQLNGMTEKINNIQYRIGGRKRITQINGKRFYLDQNRQELIDQMLLGDRYTVKKSCMICRNHLSYNSDIVVGDAWLNRYSGDRKGSNIIISRSKKATSLIESTEGYLWIEGKKDDIVESQSILYAYNKITEEFDQYFLSKHTEVPNLNASEKKLMKSKMSVKNRLILIIVNYFINKGKPDIAFNVYKVLSTIKN